MEIHFPAEHESDVQRLEAVVQRSHQGLLDVYLTDDEVDGRIVMLDSSISKRMLDNIFAESYRWRKAHLSFSCVGWNILYAPLHNRLPRLESLALYFTPLALQEQSSVPAFENCPSLTKLALSGGMLDVEFPWDQITELDLSAIVIDGAEEEHRACMRLIKGFPSLKILSTPFWDLEDDDKTESSDIPTSYSNVLKLTAMTVPAALTLPLLREACLLPDPNTAQHNCLYSFQHLLTRSNCMNGLTSLSLVSVPLAVSPDHTLHSLLLQTCNLTVLELTIRAHEYGDNTDASDREQIVMIATSLEIIPTEAVTFLPHFSSLDIRVFNHRNSWFVPYFGPVGGFASALKARWKGDDTVGLARLRTCHFAVQAQHLMDDIHRGAEGDPVPHVFDDEERFIFNTLVDDGMYLAIRITSGKTRNVRSNAVVFAVSRQ